MPERLLAPAAMATLFYLTTTAVSAQTPNTMNAEQGWSAISRCAQEDSERARHACLDRVLRDAGLLTPEMHAQQQRRAFGLDDKATRAPAPSAAPANAATAPAVATSASTASPSIASAPNGAAATASTPAAPGATSPKLAASPAAKGAAAPVTAPAVSGTPPKTVAPSASASASAGSAAAATAAAAPTDLLEVELTAVGKAADGKLLVTTKEGAVWLQTETVDMPQPPAVGDHMTIRKGSMGGYRCSVVSTHLTYRCARSR